MQPEILPHLITTTRGEKGKEERQKEGKREGTGLGKEETLTITQHPGNS